MTQPESRKISPSKSLVVQFSRLFGSTSAKASQVARTNAQWKRLLRQVLQELNRYLGCNVDTDEVHRVMLYSGLAAADHSLNDEFFWPGYVEGITRLALVLMGDYPDHRLRRRGSKKKGHYKLDLHRSVHYTRNTAQRFRALVFGYRSKLLKLDVDPEDAYMEFI